MVKCATCGATATGPAASYESAAAFELGREFGNTGGAAAGHLPCGGGLLEVTIEEIPTSPAPECPP